MITIEFNEDVRCFKAGEKLVFDANPLIFAGDQGSGKSTLLELIAPFDSGNLRRQGVKVVTTFDKKYVPVTHDFEKGNVRGSAAFGMGGIDDMTVEINMLHASHGQAAMLATRYLFDKLAKLNPGQIGLLAMDEPDSGLSITSATILGTALSRVAAKGHQIVASLHNFHAMQMATDNVYDVEQRAFVSPKNYSARMVAKALALLK